jgi:hypothetical protein
MINEYLLMNRKLTDGHEGATPDIMITNMRNGGQFAYNREKSFIELINPDKDTVKNLARIIRRTI